MYIFVKFEFYTVYALLTVIQKTEIVGHKLQSVAVGFFPLTLEGRKISLNDGISFGFHIFYLNFKI